MTELNHVTLFTLASSFQERLLDIIAALTHEPLIFTKTTVLETEGEGRWQPRGALVPSLIEPGFFTLENLS